MNQLTNDVTTTDAVPLRIAIVGGGKMGAQHAAAIRAVPGAKLVAVVDPKLSAAELRERFGNDIETFDDAVTMLEKVKPDVAHIVTPPSSHVPLAMAALERGANVYVEKPFALSVDDATRVLDFAAARGLRVCAAHQVLFQRSGQQYQRHLPTIGSLIQVDSYFSFKPVRRRADGGAPTSVVEQLIDILPHPVYLLLSAVAGAADSNIEVVSAHVSTAGEARAVLRRGETFGSLVVTLRGRPVESYLRVIGTNGAVTADFVLGGVVASLGPGASAPAVVVKPFSVALQSIRGSIASLFRLIFSRHKSYPGLAELLSRFYASIRSASPAPIDRRAILDTVRVCEQITSLVIAAERSEEEVARAAFAALEAAVVPVNPRRGVAFVTGGTGFLGQIVVRELRARGFHVRVPARCMPSFRSRVPGVEYVQADLGNAVPAELLAGVGTVVHLAAETAGNKPAHERNTVQATHNLLAAMRAQNVRRLLQIGSVAVLRPSGGVQRVYSPVDFDNLSRGPYVWAKAEEERIIARYAAETGCDVRTIRLGPLVDFQRFAPPGRLGREVARLFVAVGRRAAHLSVCDVNSAAQVIRYYTENFESAPALVNLLEVPVKQRGELVDRLRQSRPDLKIVWLPSPVLWGLSGMLKVVLKILRPRQSPLDLYSAFKSESYDSQIAQQVLKAARADAARK
jgi:predicted dehydrogenase/nucleoside-diphosphate-sugar epimerase